MPRKALNPKDKKPRQRPTVAEHEARVNDIAELITQGMRPREIVQTIAKRVKKGRRPWNEEVSERTLYDYMSRANKAFATSTVLKRDELIGIAYDRLTLIWQKTLKARQYKTALAIQKEINETFGVKKGVPIDAIRKVTLEFV